jgi:hypothetical protein
VGLRTRLALLTDTRRSSSTNSIIEALIVETAPLVRAIAVTAAASEVSAVEAGVGRFVAGVAVVVAGRKATSANR